MINSIYKFPSGLRLAHRKIDSLRSVAICVMTATGSANETSLNNGISHFVEHVMFKGTSKRDSFQISCEIDGLGAQINAFTSKQSTCYYTVSVDEYAENCVEILSDLMFHSTFPEDELEREKGVVLEEIAMSEDDPSDLCLENLSTAYFKGNALGQTILGDPSVIKGLKKSDIIEYINTMYCADNTVISIVGNIDFDVAKDLVGKYFEGGFKGERGDLWQDTKHTTASTNVVKIKDTEQANLSLVFPSLSYGDSREMALLLVNFIFGSGMSSRLYQDIREKQGLAYSVYSYPSTYKNNGNFSIYLGTNVSNGERAMKSVRKEIINLKKGGLTAEELERGKRQLKGGYILSQESSSSLMRLYAKCALFENKPFDFDERIRAIDNITQEDVRSVIDTIFDFDAVSASYLGKQPNYNLLDIIKG